MGKTIFLLFFFLLTEVTSGIPKVTEISSVHYETCGNDSIENQILYNGRLWQNPFQITEGDQFFLTSVFIHGSVTIDEKTFNNLLLRYDIYNDELLLQTGGGLILQLNKEMIEFFSLEFNNTNYQFKKFDTDTNMALIGYANVLHEGTLSVYVKYRKDLIPTSMTGGLSKFSQLNFIYINKDGKMSRVDSKKELLNQLEYQETIRDFIRSEKIRVSRKNPDGFKRVAEFYETIKH
jgi:hypothetical protein